MSTTQACQLRSRYPSRAVRSRRLRRESRPRLVGRAWSERRIRRGAARARDGARRRRPGAPAALGHDPLCAPAAGGPRANRDARRAHGRLAHDHERPAAAGRLAPGARARGLLEAARDGVVPSRRDARGRAARGDPAARRRARPDSRALRAALGDRPALLRGRARARGDHGRLDPARRGHAAARCAVRSWPTPTRGRRRSLRERDADDARRRADGGPHRARRAPHCRCPTTSCSSCSARAKSPAASSRRTGRSGAATAACSRSRASSASCSEARALAAAPMRVLSRRAHASPPLRREPSRARPARRLRVLSLVVFRRRGEGGGAGLTPSSQSTGAPSESPGLLFFPARRPRSGQESSDASPREHRTSTRSKRCRPPRALKRALPASPPRRRRCAPRARRCATCSTVATAPAPRRRRPVLDPRPRRRARLRARGCAPLARRAARRAARRDAHATSRSRARPSAGRASSTTRTSTGAATSRTASRSRARILLARERARPAVRHRVARPDHAAVPRGPHRLGGDRRAHRRRARRTARWRAGSRCRSASRTAPTAALADRRQRAGLGARHPHGFLGIDGGRRDGVVRTARQPGSRTSCCAAGGGGPNYDARARRGRRARLAPRGLAARRRSSTAPTTTRARSPARQARRLRARLAADRAARRARAPRRDAREPPAPRPPGLERGGAARLRRIDHRRVHRAATRPRRRCGGFAECGGRQHGARRLRGSRSQPSSPKLREDCRRPEAPPRSRAGRCCGRCASSSTLACTPRASCSHASSRSQRERSPEPPPPTAEELTRLEAVARRASRRRRAARRLGDALLRAGDAPSAR